MVNIRSLPADFAWDYTADESTNYNSHSPVSLSTEPYSSVRQSPSTVYYQRPAYSRGLRPGENPYYPCMYTSAYPAETRAASPPSPPPAAPPQKQPPSPPASPPADKKGAEKDKKPEKDKKGAEKDKKGADKDKKGAEKDKKGAEKDKKGAEKDNNDDEKAPSESSEQKKKKPYEEIGAIFNGNEVKIRVPKSTCKPPRLTPSQQKLQQTCTCEDDDSVCEETCGLEGADADDNRLTFQIPDDICESLTNRTALNSEMVYSKRLAHDTMCQLCNVTPEDAPKGVNAQKILHPDKDVFVLNIGKQTDEPNRTGSIQVELITPRMPAKRPPPSHFCKQVQCEEDELPSGAVPCKPPRAGAGARKRAPRKARRCR